MDNIIPGTVYACTSFRHVRIEARVLKTYVDKVHGHCAQIQVTRVPKVKTRLIKPEMVLGVKVDTLEEINA